MKRRFMFLALAAIGFASCNGGFKQGEGGLLYNIYTSKGGDKIKDGDFITFNMVVKTDGDSVLMSSYERGAAMPMVVPKSQAKGDFIAGIRLLAEGDSAMFKIAADSIFKNGQQRPPNFKGKDVVFIVKVEKLIPKGNLTEPIFRDRITQYMKAQGEAQKTLEPAKIKKYIADHNLKVTTTPSGLNYIINTPGSGAKPAAGDTAVVNYTVRLTNGKAFETSSKAIAVQEKLQINPMNPYAPIRIPVGEGKVIKGWDEGLMLLNKGSKATLIVPSSLAYGSQANERLQPYTPLVFDIEVVDIVHPNPNAPKPAAPPAMPQPQPATK